MRIVIGVDGSPYSQAAVEEVIARPWPAGTEVRVVTAIRMMPVVPPVGDYPGMEGVATTPGSVEFREQTERQAADVAERFRAAGFAADSAVHEGDPRDVLVDEAKAWPADLIVVGSHGHTGIARWLLGSVAQSVVAHAPCSVEVVRRREVR
jgi:nucleotide-binding universal stress UspA family protein